MTKIDCEQCSHFQDRPRFPLELYDEPPEPRCCAPNDEPCPEVEGEAA